MQNLSGIKRLPLKSGFPTPWNVRHYPYLDNRQQKTMVFCSVYRLGVARPFVMLKALFLTLP
jgi:hypothetical protein